MSLSSRFVMAITIAIALPTCCAAATYTVTNLGTLGGALSVGTGINLSGQVTGFSTLPGDLNQHAFLYDGTMHDLGTAAPGNAGNSIALAINNSGWITGHSTASTGTHAFLYDGTMHDLTPGAPTMTHGDGINNLGHVTGLAIDGSVGPGYMRAFVYDGSMHFLGTLGGTDSAGTGINDIGQVTGQSSTAGGSIHAFLDDGTMHDLGSLGGNSFGKAINASGNVTGYSFFSGISGPAHAFLYNGTMHDLGTLAGGESTAAAINNAGQVVGGSVNTSTSTGPRGFVYTNGQMFDLNNLIVPTAGLVITSASGINDAGQIVANGTLNGGEQHAYLLTPIIVPEPSRFVLAGLGLVFVACLRKARGRPSSPGPTSPA